MVPRCRLVAAHMSTPQYTEAAPARLHALPGERAAAAVADRQHRPDPEPDTRAFGDQGAVGLVHGVAVDAPGGGGFASVERHLARAKPGEVVVEVLVLGAVGGLKRVMRQREARDRHSHVTVADSQLRVGIQRDVLAGRERQPRRAPERSVQIGPPELVADDEAPPVGPCLSGVTASSPEQIDASPFQRLEVGPAVRLGLAMRHRVLLGGYQRMEAQD